MINKQKTLEVLHTFANSFDTKNWQEMHDCLAEEIYIDYASFRKTKAQTISNEKYVALRKIGLKGLQTKHEYNNFSFSPQNNGIICECDFIIQRFQQGSTAFFHSYGSYTFELENQNDALKIVKIRQTVHRNEGDSSIHGAFKKP